MKPPVQMSKKLSQDKSPQKKVPNSLIPPLLKTPLSSYSKSCKPESLEASWEFLDNSLLLNESLSDSDNEENIEAQLTQAGYDFDSEDLDSDEDIGMQIINASCKRKFKA